MAYTGYCSRCGEAAELRDNDSPSFAATDRGVWLVYDCRCGNRGFIREADLDDVDTTAWRKAADGKRRPTGNEREANPRAHWLSG